MIASKMAPFVLFASYPDTASTATIRGGLVCGKKVAFGGLGPNASSLTVLDICNSHYAVACIGGTFPTGNPKTFKRKKYFETSKFDIPVICDINDSTWAFRIGFHDQDENDDESIKFFVHVYPHRRFGGMLPTCGSKSIPPRPRARKRRSS